MKFRWLGFALLTIVALAMACDDDDSSSPEDQLCDDLGELRSAVGEIDDIGGGDQSVEDNLRDTREDIENAVEDVQASAQDVASARTTDLQAAWINLQNALQGDGDQSAIQALADSRDELRIFLDELTSVDTSVSCDEASATPAP